MKSNETWPLGIFLKKSWRQKNINKFWKLLKMRDLMPYKIVLYSSIKGISNTTSVYLFEYALFEKLWVKFFSVNIKKDLFNKSQKIKKTILCESHNNWLFVCLNFKLVRFSWIRKIQRIWNWTDNFCQYCTVDPVSPK